MKEDQIDMDLLQKEYFHLQSVIENFDSKSLTIKAWSVSVAGAIAGSGMYLESKIVILFASIVSLMFWYIDGYWKTFQYANYRRLGHIESYLKTGAKQIIPLQITRSWNASHNQNRQKRFIKIMLWPHVVLPHGAMFFLLLAVFVLYQFFPDLITSASQTMLF